MYIAQYSNLDWHKSIICFLEHICGSLSLVAIMTKVLKHKITPGNVGYTKIFKLKINLHNTTYTHYDLCTLFQVSMWIIAVLSVFLFEWFLWDTRIFRRTLFLNITYAGSPNIPYPIQVLNQDWTFARPNRRLFTTYKNGAL